MPCSSWSLLLPPTDKLPFPGECSSCSTARSAWITARIRRKYRRTFKGNQRNCQRDSEQPSQNLWKLCQVLVPRRSRGLCRLSRELQTPRAVTQQVVKCLKDGQQYERYKSCRYETRIKGFDSVEERPAIWKTHGRHSKRHPDEISYSPPRCQSPPGKW